MNTILQLLFYAVDSKIEHAKELQIRVILFFIIAYEDSSKSSLKCMLLKLIQGFKNSYNQ